MFWTSSDAEKFLQRSAILPTGKRLLLTIFETYQEQATQRRHLRLMPKIIGWSTVISLLWTAAFAGLAQMVPPAPLAAYVLLVLGTSWLAIDYVPRDLPLTTPDERRRFLRVLGLAAGVMILCAPLVLIFMIMRLRERQREMERTADEILLGEDHLSAREILSDPRARVAVLYFRAVSKIAEHRATRSYYRMTADPAQERDFRMVLMEAARELPAIVESSQATPIGCLNHWQGEFTRWRNIEAELKLETELLLQGEEDDY